MDIKRLLLALVLSFVFMITYTALFIDDPETSSSDNTGSVDQNEISPVLPKEQSNNQNTQSSYKDQSEQQIIDSQNEDKSMYEY